MSLMVPVSESDARCVRPSVWRDATQAWRAHGWRERIVGALSRKSCPLGLFGQRGRD
jgi:hypothetical protein